MYGFLISLLVGFVLARASAFTAAYSQRWGERGSRVATLILRNFLGIPYSSSASFSPGGRLHHCC